MQRLRHDQVRAAATTLAVAFHDDPLLEIVQPDPDRRRATGTWFMRVSLTYGLAHGEVWANEDVSAVAIWFPPGRTTLNTLGMLRAGMIRLPLKVGLRVRFAFSARSGRPSRSTSRSRARTGTCWRWARGPSARARASAVP